MQKLRNPGRFDHSQGCPRDQLFWCTVHPRQAILAVGSYHGNIYIARISMSVASEKISRKLQRTEREIQNLAGNIVREVIKRAVLILVTLSGQ